MKIEFSESADADLIAIESYIRQDNPNAASVIIMRILEAIEYLTTYPTMGRRGRLAKTRELIISGTPFIVIYQIEPSIISISRILHAARKWPVK